MPSRFHASKTPCLGWISEREVFEKGLAGFHRLVTKSSRSIVDIAEMLGQIISWALRCEGAEVAWR